MRDAKFGETKRNKNEMSKNEIVWSARDRDVDVNHRELL